MGRLLLVLPILFLPTHLLFASVSISEVAWMGSTQSANHEWIELHNDADAVSVDGWVLNIQGLAEDGKTYVVELNGTIPANSYVVLGNVQGSVIDSSPLIYKGNVSLVNTGADITLFRGDGTIVDSVAGGKNWENISNKDANTTKETAQYSTSGWITAIPTPGRANATTGSVQTASVTSSGSSSTNTSTLASTKTITSKSTTSSKSFSLQINTPNFIYAGQPAKFSTTASGVDSTIHKSVHHRWNFGDLNTSSEAKPTHTFTYPGTYSVVVNGSWNGQDASAQIEVTVLPVTVSLSYSLKGDVLLQNDAMYQVDVSGYYLDATRELQIPALTFIPPRGTLTVPWKMLGDTHSPPTFLRGREKEIITSTYVTKPVEVESSVSVAVAPTTSAQPVAQSQSVSIEEGLASESISAPAPFGFATAVAYAGEGEISEGINPTQAVADSNGVTSETRGGEEGDALGVTPLLPSLTDSKNSNPKTPTTWWPYLLLIIILGGAVIALIYKPKM